MTGFVGCLSGLHVDELTLQLDSAAADYAGSAHLLADQLLRRVESNRNGMKSNEIKSQLI